MEPGLRRPDRDAQDVGDRGKRESLQVMEDDDRAFLDAETPERSIELVAIDQQLMKLYAKLEEAGIPAGSPVTRRLFSQ